MKYSFAFPLLATLLLLTGCEVARSPSTTPTSVAVSPTPTPSAIAELAKPTSEQFTISEQGIGEAQLGMTLGELKAKLGESYQFEAITPFIVGFDAIAVSQKGEGEILYHILHPMGATLADSDAIEWLLTQNPQFRTAEGVGPETSIPQAETVYGDATLRYNPDNESREYIEFANFPSKNVKFQSALGEIGLAGIYAGEGIYETTEFRDGAAIDWILVGQ